MMRLIALDSNIWSTIFEISNTHAKLRKPLHNIIGCWWITEIVLATHARNEQEELRVLKLDSLYFTSVCQKSNYTVKPCSD